MFGCSSAYVAQPNHTLLTNTKRAEAHHLRMYAATAPRGAQLYPPRSGEGLEVMSLGLMAYRTSKEDKGQ